MKKLVRKNQISTPQTPKTTPKRRFEIVEMTFMVFVDQASQASPDSKFLEELRKLTGHDSVKVMVKRFQKLAGIA